MKRKCNPSREHGACHERLENESGIESFLNLAARLRSGGADLPALRPDLHNLRWVSVHRCRLKIDFVINRKIDE